MDGYKYGDVTVTNLTVSSTRGTLDLSKSFVSMSIYESIFTPGIIADIVVLDTDDTLGNLKLSGDEIVTVTMYVLGSLTKNYSFSLSHLKDLAMTSGQQKGKQYTLECVSDEPMYAKTNYVQKSYNMLCSEIIKDIHTNYLHSKKQLQIEDTIGPQNIVIPHKSPFEAIDFVRGRSVSSKYNSSSYVYFENTVQGPQQYNFVTIESMFDLSSTKDFIQNSAINTDFYSRIDNNIISYTVPKQFNSIQKIALAGPRKISTMNFTSQEYQSNTVQTKDTNYKTGGSGTDTSSSFISRFFNALIPPQSLLPVDISQRASTHIETATPNLQAYLSILSQNAMKIKVVGDTVLTAGIKINCTIPNKTGTADAGIDPLLSGDFIVSRIHHRIGMFQDTPRYTCTMELLKGSYSEAVQ
jgi:hypothetical protein